MGVSQLHGTDSLGGYLSMAELSKRLRHAAQKQAIWRQFCDPIDGFGRNKGDTFNYDKVGHLDLTDVGVPLVETAKIPEATVAYAQASITVNEYGKKVPYTGKLTKLGEIDSESAAVKELKYHMLLTHNKLASDEFKKAKIKYAPTGTASSPTATWDTDGTQTSAAARDIQVFDVEEILEYLKDTTNTPPRADGNFVCVHSPGFATALRRDSKWQTLAEYAQPKDAYQGEIGKFLNMRFVESNYGLSSRMKTSYRGEAVIFGADAVAQAVADPEHIFYGEDPEEGGRSKVVGWLGIFGYKITWDSAAAGEARIVHICGTA
jgi:N4-gp56 family major capsid protein